MSWQPKPKPTTLTLIAYQTCTPKVLWTYETVAEPTGVTSKYWDADAPTERATKKLANEKLVATKDSNYDNQGKQIFYPHFRPFP